MHDLSSAIGQAVQAEVLAETQDQWAEAAKLWQRAWNLAVDLRQGDDLLRGLARCRDFCERRAEAIHADEQARQAQAQEQVENGWGCG